MVIVYSLCLCHTSILMASCHFLSESSEITRSTQAVGAQHSLMRPRPVGHRGVFLAKQMGMALGIGAKYTVSNHIWVCLKIG